MKHINRTSRHFFRVLIFTFCIVLAFAGLSYGLLKNTKHNLSSSSTGKVKAVSESMMCEFCHIPHNNNPAVPVWNALSSDAAYTMYKSEYLQRAGYEAPVTLGKYPEPGYRSRFCLSCHDGTVAVGGVYVLKGTALSSPKKLIGVTAEGKLPASTGAYLGVDLTNDHPVGIKYDSSISIHFGQGVRSMELKTPAPPVEQQQYKSVRLFPPRMGTVQGYVECTSCHDPHTETPKFLLVSAATTAKAANEICDSCHAKVNWSGSAHQTSVRTYKDPLVIKEYGSNSVNNMLCLNCHVTHSGYGRPYLLRLVEENNCFRGAATNSNMSPCHGRGASVNGGKEIEDVIKRPFGHPTTTITGIHTDLDVLSPEYMSWSDKKHAECVDCHNPHQSTTGSHTPPNQWYPNVATLLTNNVSNALKGVTGVEPAAWGPAGEVPTSFITLESATKEYQICFKCHSYYSLQDIDGITMFTTASNATLTDQSMEFTVNNKSVHPVVTSLNNQLGSTQPKALNQSRMLTPWTTTGNQTMYCSDCHGADNEAGNDPKGPHGSSYKFMLKGRGKSWPVTPGGDLWRWSNRNNDLFCANCHSFANVGSSSATLHSSPNHNVPCVYCHIVIPHGSKRSRLIGYSTDTQPYNYNGNSLKIKGFRKASGFGYTKNDCSTVPGCHFSPAVGAWYEQ